VLGEFRSGLVAGIGSIEEPARTSGPVAGERVKTYLVNKPVFRPKGCLTPKSMVRQTRRSERWTLESVYYRRLTVVMLKNHRL
jgi:hypothetical protein